MDYRKQAAINSIGSVVLMFGQWLISVLLVRMSGYEDAGIFSLAMTVSNVFSFFANYGLRNYQVADVNGQYTQGQYLLLRVFTGTASVLACGVYLFVAGGYSPVERWAIVLYLLYSDVNVMSDTLLGALQLHDRLYMNGYSNILRGSLCFLLFVGTYMAVHNLLAALLAMVAATLVLTLAYDWRQFRRFEQLTPWRRSDLQAVGRLLRSCFALMLSSILPVVTTAVPRLSIQKISGTEQLGYFSSIFTPTVLITTLAPAIIIALVPQMARAWSVHDRKGVVTAAAKSYGMVFALIVLAELAAVVAGRPVMRLLFGEEILQYYPLLYWAILATGLNGWTYCGNSALVAIGFNRAVAVAAAVVLVVILGLSDRMVFAFGITGAAYVLAIAYGIQTVVQLAMLAYGLCRTGRKQT